MATTQTKAASSKPLKTYEEKRNFSHTPEPTGGRASKERPLTFVVQRHDASRLHYDFRLEMNGVLKSWAVPKGPSLNPGDKRLAMMVEDHPLDYAHFSGTIPEGNYGAGEVEIWDEGTYTHIGEEDRAKGEKELLKDLKAGSLKFVLKGKHLHGEFALVRMKGRDMHGDPWLLIKHDDRHAVHKAFSAEDLKPLTSTVARLRKNEQVASSPIKKTSKQENLEDSEARVALDPREHLLDLTHVPLLKKAPMPHQVRPMLATLTDAPFDDATYIYEIKFDGYRAVADVRGGKVQLYSRNLTPFNGKYPAIVEDLATLGQEAILDGEIVVLDKEGKSRFQLLQDYASGKGHHLCYYAFDLLYLNGYDLRALPLLERKHLLETILPKDGPIRYSAHIAGMGTAFFERAAASGLEGIIAKQAHSTYQTGKRTQNWLKIKTSQRQEAVIMGYTEPAGSRKYIGSLVLATWENGQWNYVGNCGTGFNQKSLAELHKKLKPSARQQSPFDHKVLSRTPITWVRPDLVCEVEFTEWTSEGSMRHPVFQGLRTDKDPKEVKRETPIQSNEKPTGKPRRRTLHRYPPYEQAASRVAEARPVPIRKPHSAEGKNEAPAFEMSSSKKELALPIGRHKVRITNPAKLYWPDEKITKLDVVNYYQSVSQYILPYLKDRAENLLRHPNGAGKPAFFHKDMGDDLSEWIRTEDIYSESNDRTLQYLICNDAATLAYMNNLGCIEINPWNSRVQHLDSPDYIVIDLDPADNTFEEVITVAQAVKEVLDRAGIQGYPKTSGSTGLHIYIPLGAKYPYEVAGQFAQVIAQLAHELLPKLTSVERAVAKRPKQIYMDYLQNRHGQTLASVYSLRPKPGATVSMPLEWKEVKSGLHPSQFHIHNALERIEKNGDLFRPVLGKGVDIAKALRKLKG